MEPQNHRDACYFYSIDTTGLNKKKCKSKSYPCLKCAIWPVPHSSEVPVPLFSGLSLILINLMMISFMMLPLTRIPASVNWLWGFFFCWLNYNELSGLIRYLSLSKESAELLASWLKEKFLLKSGTRGIFYQMTFYRNSWRLFIESSKHSLKIVLMHSTNIYASIPIGHSSTLKEKHEFIKQVMERIKYTKHNWVICLDLKMVNFLLVQQSGYTRFPCFCACGTVKREIITGKERTGRFEHDWKVAKKCSRCVTCTKRQNCLPSSSH